MQKIYLLLRNNKQSGPYSRDELLQLSLKQHDLIWVEGKSAGWRNPEDIPELKTEMEPVVTETFAVRNPGVDSIALSAGLRSKKEAAKHIYISLPSGASITTQEVKTEVAATLPPEEGQETFDERVARMQQKIAAYNNNPKIEDKETVDNKYARSLDDIKDEYASWKHQQKRKKTFPLKPVMMAAASLLLIALVSYFILRNDTTSDAAPLLENARLAVAKEAEDLYEKASAVQQPSVQNTTARYEDNKPTVSSASKRKLPAKNSSPVPKKTGAETVNKAEVKSVTKTVAVKVAADEPPVTEAVVPLSQLIKVYGEEITGEKNKGIEGVKLTVQNNSRQMLKMVAVDVFYYGSTGRQLHKKTMYFSNLNPHRSLSLTAPGHIRAAAVDFKLGLVSTENGLYYAKQ